MAQDSKAPSHQSPQQAAGLTESQDLEGSLETIKEILVGEHSREIQKKLVQLDARLTRELAELQAQGAKRDQSLETFVLRELQALRDDFKVEQQERTKAMERVTSELASTFHLLEQKLGQASQTAAATFRELRELMMGQYKELSEEIVSRHRVLSEEIEKAVAGLENRKPDRQLIATIMLRMAAALQSEPMSTTSKVTELTPKAGKKSA